MEEARYKVIFRGRVESGTRVDDAKRALASLMQAKVDQLELLFSGQSVVIKKNLTADLAVKYVNAFREAGAVAEMRPHGEEPDAPDETGPRQSFGSRFAGSKTTRINTPRSDVSAGMHEPIPTTTTERAPDPQSMNQQISTPMRDYSDESPVAEGIVFIIKLILTLIVTAILVGALLVAVLWVTSSLQLLGINNLDELIAGLQGLAANLGSLF